MLQYNTIGECFPFGPISVQLGLAPFARFSRGTFGVSVSETTGLKALSLPRPLGAGPSRSQRHGRRWFPIPIPQKVPCAWKKSTKGDRPQLYKNIIFAYIKRIYSAELTLLWNRGFLLTILTQHFFRPFRLIYECARSSAFL